MDKLPHELEEIVYEFVHNLKMKDVLDELKENFFTCNICLNTIHNNINPVWKYCQCCKEPICFECSSDLEDIEFNECNDCYYQSVLISHIERTLKRDMLDDERHIIWDLILPLNTSQKEELVYSYFILFGDILDDNLLFAPFAIIYSEVVDIIQTEL